MCVQTIFPISNLLNLLVTVLVLFIVVWSRRIVNVIPILSDLNFDFVLFSFLASPSLPLLPTVETIDIFIVIFTGPVCKRRLHLWS